MMKKFQLKFMKKLVFGLATCLAVLFLVNFSVGVNYDQTESNGYASSVVVDGLIADKSLIDDKFSLTKNYPIMSENQTTSSHCWIYSSLKALESSLMVQRGEYYNFSEVGMAYLAYASGIKSSINEKGIFQDFSTVANQQGLIHQSDVSNDIYFDMSKDNIENYEYIKEKTSRNVIDSVSTLDLIQYTNYKALTSNEKELFVKRYIKTYGGLFVGLEDGILYNDGVYVYSEQTNKEAEKVYLGGKHAVCLIGWDNRFGFLALNSWGELHEEFYIPYTYTKMYETLGGFICDEEVVSLKETTA